MWLAFNDGFISIVADRNDGNRLVVRSRRREALNNLFPECDIIVDGGSDYRYRMFVRREELASLAYKRIMAIRYSNFKNSVNEPDLYELYESFWSLHRAYQK